MAGACRQLRPEAGAPPQHSMTESADAAGGLSALREAIAAAGAELALSLAQNHMPGAAAVGCAGPAEEKGQGDGYGTEGDPDLPEEVRWHLPVSSHIRRWLRVMDRVCTAGSGLAQPCEHALLCL